MKSHFQRGVSALATVLTALSVFAILTASVGQLAIERLRGTSRSNIQVRAKYATTYGIERVCQFLETHVSYDNPNNSLNIAPIDYNNFQTNHTLVPLSQDPESRYTARLFSNLNGTASITAPDGVVIAPGQIYIQMLGQVGEQIAKVSSRHSGTMAHIGIQEFPYAVLSDGPITISNSTINAYASALTSVPGPLNATYAANSNPPGIFSGIARLASNSRLNSIVLNNSNVDGTLHFGSGGDPAAALNITGSSPAAGTALAQPIFLTKYKPPVSPSAATAVATVSGAGNSLVINAGTYYSSVNVSNGATLTLHATQPGTNNFYFSESLLLTDATLRLDLASPAENCRIKVYIGDRLVARNSLINPYERDATTNLATQGWSYSLQLFGVGRGGPLGHSEIELDNSTCCALIAGSKTNVKVTGGSHFYGAVKAKSFELTNSNLYYDAAVTLANVRRTLWGLVSWTLQGVSDYQGESLFIELGGGAAAAAAIGPAALGPATAASLGAAGDAVTAAAGGAAGDAAAINAAAATADAAAAPAAATATAADAAAATATAADAATTTATAADAAAATTADAAAAAATAVTDAVATSAATTTADAAAATTADAAAVGDAAATAAAGDAVGDAVSGSTTVGNAGYDAFYYTCPGPNTHCP